MNLLGYEKYEALFSCHFEILLISKKKKENWKSDSNSKS